MKYRFLIIPIQLLIAAIIFYHLVGSIDELKLLFLILMLVNLIAVGLSFAIAGLQRKEGHLPIMAILHLISIILFYATGYYLQEYLRFEIIEEMAPDQFDPAATVVAARLVTYGGMEFGIIYLLNVIVAYVPFLQFKKMDREKPFQEVSNKRLTIRIGNRLHLIPFEDIEFIEASGNYLNVFAHGKKYVGRMTMVQFLDSAQVDHLVRVHRSFVVNLDKVRGLETVADGQAIVLESGKTIKVGRQYKDAVYEKLGL